MFIFWFNTYFVKCGYTPDKPDGGGEKNFEYTDEEGSEHRTFTLSKEDLDKANKDKKHKIYPPEFKVKYCKFSSYLEACISLCPEETLRERLVARALVFARAIAVNSCAMQNPSIRVLHMTEDGYFCNFCARNIISNYESIWNSVMEDQRNKI